MFALSMVLMSTMVSNAEANSVASIIMIDRPEPQISAPKPQLMRRWQVTLSPFAHVRFCVQNPDQCVRKRVSIRKPGIVLTKARLDELQRVNLQVNRAIRPSLQHEGITGDTWTLNPPAGDCDDYAVTKRARLLDAGWPSSALLLTHVLAQGQHHLVLTVRMKGGDIVLDNLSGTLRFFNVDRMDVISIQSPVNPNMWLRPLDEAPLIARASERGRV